MEATAPVLGFDLPLEQLVGTLLVALRIAAFVVVAPPFANRAINGRVKALLAIALAVAVAPAVDMSAVSTEAGARSVCDSPLPSNRVTPVTSIFASVSAPMTACAEPSKLAGSLRAMATCRARASASMLSDKRKRPSSLPQLSMHGWSKMFRSRSFGRLSRARRMVPVTSSEASAATVSHISLCRGKWL